MKTVYTKVNATNIVLETFSQSEELKLNDMGVAKMELDKSTAFHSTVSELFFLSTTTIELSFPLAVANQKSAKMADD